MRPLILGLSALLLLLAFLNIVAEHVLQSSASGKEQTLPSSHLELAQGTKWHLNSSSSGQRSQVSTYHTIVTCDGSVYAQWQVRVQYFHWKALKQQEGPGSPVGGYTRLLHSGYADGLMAEVPTVVVDPLPPEVPDGGYIVLHRPYALLQWVRLGYSAKANEDYIFMTEPDYLFVALPRLMATRHMAASYHFTYMDPKLNAHVINKFNTKKVAITDVYPVGNAPTMVAKKAFQEICPIWYDLAVRFKRSEEVERSFGWILEMYAWSVASSQLEEGPLKYELHKEMMAQPPWDGSMTKPDGTPINIIHYTYGQDCRESDGKPLTGQVGSWHFDKRDYEHTYPPGHIRLPTKCDCPTMIAVAKMINEASAAIEPWQIEMGPRG